jgi:hypothetical protein
MIGRYAFRGSAAVRRREIGLRRRFLHILGHSSS